VVVVNSGPEEGVGALAGGFEFEGGLLVTGEFPVTGELLGVLLATGAGAGEGLDSAWAGTSVVVVVVLRVIPAIESVVVTVSVGAAAGTAVAPAWGSQLDTTVPPSSDRTMGNESR
jgi:hypothetical protein